MSVILMVEDDLLVGSTLEIVLVRAGHTVFWAQDGAEALETFDLVQPELVITDIIMRGMCGIELIKQLRSLAPGLPIIAMTGGGKNSIYDLLGTAKDGGATAVIRKPFTNRDLVALVGSLVTMRAAA